MNVLAILALRSDNSANGCVKKRGRCAKLPTIWSAS